MKRLRDILKVRTQTDTLLLLEVKPNSQIDLIEHGFNGNEKMFRLQIGNPTSMYPSKMFTMFIGEDLKPSPTYNWGGYGTTMASEEWTFKRNQIVNVAHELGFKI